MNTSEADAFTAGLPDTDPQINRARWAVQQAKKKGLIRGEGDPDMDKIKRQVFTVKRPAIDKEEGGAVDAADLVGVKTKWMNVTPEIAEKWLAANVRNRSLSKDVVAAYAREMRAGRWLPVHQGMAFNNKDELIDGQHRLHAIVKSGTTVRMMVTFGLPSRVNGEKFIGMDVVDRGRPRSVADQLKIQHGIKDGSVLAMVCSRLAAICTPERTRRLSVAEVLQIWGEFESAVNFVIEHRSKEHGLRQAGCMAGFAFAIAVLGEDPLAGDVRRMYRALVFDDELGTGDPITLLRAFLTSEEAVLLGRGNDRALAELVMLAILLQVQGKKIDRLELDPAGLQFFRDLGREKAERIAAMFRFTEEAAL